MSLPSAPHPQTASRLALSELAPGVMQSEIRAMTTECDRMGGINLAQGVCDTPGPAPVEAEAHAAIRAGHNIYTRLDGIARLRKAISAKQKERLRPRLRPRDRSAGGVGATGGLHAAAMALLNPGDEVLLFEPFYGYHVATLKSHARQAGAGSAGRARLGARHRRAARRHHAAHPRHSAQHARQPQRQNLSRAPRSKPSPQSAASTTCSSSPMRFTSTSSTTAPTHLALPRCPACASAPS